MAIIQFRKINLKLLNLVSHHFPRSTIHKCRNEVLLPYVQVYRKATVENTLFKMYKQYMLLNRSVLMQLRVQQSINQTRIFETRKIKILVRQSFEKQFCRKLLIIDIQTNLHYKQREISLELQNYIIEHLHISSPKRTLRPCRFIYTFIEQQSSISAIFWGFNRELWKFAWKVNNKSR